MLETSKWIYLDLEKTGSTFLRKKLLDIYPISEFLITKKHLPQTKKSTKIKLITIGILSIITSRYGNMSWKEKERFIIIY